MAHRSSRGPTLPDSLESPDVGFVAGAGLYVGAILVGVALTGGLAVGASVPAIAGSLSTVGTAGVVLGAALSSRVEGLPERLGRRSRRLALLFVPAATFGALVPVALVVPSVPWTVALGAGLAAVASAVVALVVTAMARTRYAQAMAPEEPRAAFPLLKYGRYRYWVGFGLLCIALSVAAVATWDDPGVLPWQFAFYGLFALFVGATYRFRYRDGGGLLERVPLLPDRTRRRILGAEWVFDMGTAVDALPELRIHEAGLIAKRSLGQRFVPWSAVTDVRLDDDELVVERRDWLDLRCDRAVIDDPEDVYATIQRVRGADDTGTG